ncbi:hypothetical protein ACQ4PT_035290 [Festuca glaucescens]
MEFISLGPNDEKEGNLQTETLAATAVASEPHDGPPSTSTKASANDIIDLEEGQFASEPDAKDDQTKAVDVNGLEPLASEHQPQDRPSTVDSAKASVEIADLEGGQVACKAGAEDTQGAGDLQAEPLIVNGVDATKASDEIIDLEEGQVEDMDLSDDGEVIVKRQTSDAPVQAPASVPALVQTLHGVVSVGIDKGNGPGIVTQVRASSSTFIDESPTRGVKRARVESAEPSVRVIYNNLTRESKRRLMELMQQWSEWQARKQHTLTDSVEEVLECGEETYYPALHVGSERSAVKSFWVDSQARENVAVDDGAVPLYNREFTLGSTPLGDPSNTESKQDKDDSRCFNCGSYSHALKDCPKPRDHVAISNARKQHNSKRNLSNVSRGQNRYYQKTPGKFDDLKAGVLGSETRECLGLRENDPPPWLHRMRELGYPPGYLDEVEDEDKPSGITIFGDGEAKAEHEGELPEQGEPSPPLKRMTVEFPGINAPVPENGDPWLWGSTPPQSSSGRHHHPSSDSRDRGPPGAEHYSSSRYHPYDHGPATPGLVRSHSDRGRRSSSGYYENPPPPPGEEGAWTPHAYSSRQHSSGSEMSSRHSRERERERERDWHDRHYYNSSRR